MAAYFSDSELERLKKLISQGLLPTSVYKTGSVKGNAIMTSLTIYCLRLKYNMDEDLDDTIIAVSTYYSFERTEAFFDYSLRLYHWLEEEFPDLNVREYKQLCSQKVEVAVLKELRRLNKERQKEFKKPSAQELRPKKIRKAEEKLAKQQLLIQHIIDDFPYYSNAELMQIYRVSAEKLRTIAREHHLCKTPGAKRLRKAMSEGWVDDYFTRPHEEIARELGIKTDSLKRRARRIGIHTTFPEQRALHTQWNTRLIQCFSSSYTVEQIAQHLGLTKRYVRKVINENRKEPQNLT